MRMEFDDFNKQMVYVSKFVRNYTNLEKKCQICGKPADIKHNIHDPYKIQLVCNECKRNNQYDESGMIYGVPLIDLYNYITNTRIKESFISKSSNNINKLELILKSKNFTREKAYKLFNGSATNFNKTVDFYEKEINPNIRTELENIFNQERTKSLRASRQKSTLNSSNNLSMIKYKKNISNRQLSKLTNNQIKPVAISLICTGKTNPKLKTKCILAEALNVSVYDIFPEDTLYKDIHNYTELVNYQNTIRDKLQKVLNSKNITFKNYGDFIRDNQLNLSIYRLYDFVSTKVLINHSELLSLVEYLNKIS